MCIRDRVTAIYLLLQLAATEPGLQFLEALFVGSHIVGPVLVGLTLLSTVISGWNYVWNNRKLIEWDA